MCEKGELEEMPELGEYGRLVDKCMVQVLRQLHQLGYETLGCCCGHGKYPKTIVVMNQITDVPYEFYTGMNLIRLNGVARRRNFYKMDDEGYYYIPGTLYADGRPREAEKMVDELDRIQEQEDRRRQQKLENLNALESPNDKPKRTRMKRIKEVK